MIKLRLDNLLVNKKLVDSRSQADNFIRLGEVQVNGKIIQKAGYFVNEDANIKVTANERYVSRAGLKLASVSHEFKLNFKGATVLDVGSSTGGFTDYALKNGAKKVIAVDVGTNQLHPKLQTNNKIELHEQTDIRSIKQLSSKPDIVVIDVSFISLRQVLPHIVKIASTSQVVAMLKPQFEVGAEAKHKGVIKNEKIRRDIIKKFEIWLKEYFVIISKSDSKISGSKGNLERFYLLKSVI